MAYRQIVLRAFRIENPTITEPNSGILRFMQQVLTSESTAAQRRMTLNQDDPDRDLIANFTWASNNAYVFGMMLRVIPADNGGILDERVFNRNFINLSDLNTGNPDQSQYKDHYYFALNNNYLVTNLSGNINISRLQTYINWLLESVRGTRLFQFTEMTKLPEGISFNQIKDIQFVGGGVQVTAAPTEPEYTTFSSYLSNLKDEIIAHLLGVDHASLESIRENQLVEATLVMKIKNKPKEMAQEEFQRAMEAVATNITNDSGVVIRTKDGTKYTGEAVKLKKSVTVGITETNRIIEEQLKQEMEQFLNEIGEE